MINKWWRESNIASGIQVVLRLLLGYTFLTGGLHKIGGFDASGYLSNAVANPVKGPDGSLTFGLYHSFLESFALPNVGLFNVLVPWGELLIGIGLILGCLTTAAVFFAMVMNFSFLMAGTVSSNPLDVLYGFLIITAGANAGKYGLDHWVLPYLHKFFNKGKEKEHSTYKSA